MNWTNFVIVFALMAVGSLARPENDGGTHENHAITQADIKKYLEMLEKLDIDKVLNNTRLMSNNIKCFMDEGPCTSQTKEMKKMLPLLVKDSCSTCTKEQKLIVKKAMDKVKELRPNEYEKLKKFFDPEGKYEKKFLENINKS